MNRLTVLGSVAGTGVLALAVLLPARPGSAGPEPSYEGAESCKKCHLKQYKAWKETKMAKSFETLKPGQVKEAKEKWKLDPAKDYTQEARCLACHTTGYGKSGGYPAAGAAWTEEQKKLAVAREGVQCESCHGPGSLTIPVKKDNKEYTIDQIRNLGWQAADDKSCLACHNPDSPTVAPDAKFDFETMHKMDKELHEHVELKYKH